MTCIYVEVCLVSLVVKHIGVQLVSVHLFNHLHRHVSLQA